MTPHALPSPGTDEVERLRAELAVVKRNWAHLSESLISARKEIAGRKEHGERLQGELTETVAAHMAYRQQTAALKSAVEEVLSDPIMHSPLGEPLVRVADVLAALAVPDTSGSHP